MKPRTMILIGTLAFAVGAAVMMPTQLLPLIVFLAFVAIVLAVADYFRDVPPADGDGAVRPRLLSRSQCIEIGMLPAFFLLLFVLMLHIKYDYIKSLWEHPLGIKMIVSTVVLVSLATAAVALLSFLKNRLEPKARGLRFLLACAAVFTYLVLITPACLILLLGPAIIQIVEGFQ